MHRLKCIYQLFKYPQCLFFGEGASASDVIFQCASLAVLVNQINVTVSFYHLDKLNNIDVVFKKLKDLNLIFGKLN